MKTSFLIIIFLFLDISLKNEYVAAQTKTEDPIIFSGKCIDVLNSLILHFEKDSTTAVLFFKKNYFIIENKGYQRCRLSNEKVYNYFSDLKQKETRCILKKVVFERTLLK